MNLIYPQVPNLGVVIETSTDLGGWTPWNVPGNQPLFPAAAGNTILSGALDSVTNRLFRARLIEA